MVILTCLLTRSTFTSGLIPHLIVVVSPHRGGDLIAIGWRGELRLFLPSTNITTDLCNIIQLLSSDTPSSTVRRSPR
jgi:hypothetical protein